ncbi:MAG: alpha-amylase family glycosyl hydrolase [Pyrinomonadaceae bacterium]
MKKRKYTFRLFAPNNLEASVIGDFSNWKEVPMTKGSDGYFSVVVKLADAAYQYKFKIRSKSWFNQPDEWKTITDPYATDVDQLTQNAILKMKDGKKIVDEYVWRSDAVPLPENSHLVIYEMHVGDFSGGENDPFERGAYTDVIEKLDYLSDLGINAIELMPLKTTPGDFNWGYSPAHYFAPEPSYGSTAELKRLVDECHARGVRVIVDGVYNHASTSNALTQIDHDYWFRREGKDPEQNWGPEFNYELIDDRFGICPAREFILDSIRYFIYEYRIDGIRFDAAKQINNFDALREFVRHGRKMAEMKPFFTVAEYIPPSPEVTEPDGPIESCWNDSFMYSMLEYLGGETPNLEKIKFAIDPRRLGFAGTTSTTNYLSNHDQNRVFRKLGEKGILDDELYTRAKLGGLILMTAVGVPMIWMGEEFGEHSVMSEASNKIDWTLLEHGPNADLLAFYKKLIAFRTSHAAFASEKIEFFHESPDVGVLAFHRFDDNSNSFAVVLNLSDDDAVQYSIPSFPLGHSRELTSEADFDATDNVLTIDIPRRSGLIFVSR